MPNHGAVGSQQSDDDQVVFRTPEQIFAAFDPFAGLFLLIQKWEGEVEAWMEWLLRHAEFAEGSWQYSFAVQAKAMLESDPGFMQRAREMVQATGIGLCAKEDRPHNDGLGTDTADEETATAAPDANGEEADLPGQGGGARDLAGHSFTELACAHAIFQFFDGDINRFRKWCLEDSEDPDSVYYYVCAQKLEALSKDAPEALEELKGMVEKTKDLLAMAWRMVESDPLRAFTLALDTRKE
jgi:hypothetical protein